MGVLRRYVRFLQILWHFLPFILAYARDRRRFLFLGRPRQPTEATQQYRADKLVALFLDLGPTFIKLGQLLSTRPDVLPPVYVATLSQLQDAVPAASWEQTRPVIESSIGPLDERFSAFETEAISGASLGQVYRAEIDDTTVAVKVRRPGITKRVETDLRILQTVLPVLTRFLGEAQAFSLANLADEFAKVIRQEMDYKRERHMLLEIRDNFADDPNVIIPDVVESHCTDRILTMEYRDGIKITAVEELNDAGINRRELAATLERTYLQMVLEDGVFHADPHPGNIAVSETGALIFYDFGMSGRVPPQTRSHIVSFYLSVAERDIQGILDALTAMGTLSPSADRQLMGDVMELAIEDASGASIDEWRVQEIVSRVESTMYEFPLRLPAELALILRVATVVEGVCVTLDPEFDFVSVATEFLTERGYREESVRRFVTDIRGDLGAAGLAAVRSAPKAERMLDRFERNDVYVRAGVEDADGVFDTLAWRLGLSFAGAAGIIGSAILYVDVGLGWVLYGLIAITAISWLFFIRSFRQRQSLRARPQFTRQNLRERRDD